MAAAAAAHVPRAAWTAVRERFATARLTECAQRCRMCHAYLCGDGDAFVDMEMVCALCEQAVRQYVDDASRAVFKLNRGADAAAGPHTLLRDATATPDGPVDVCEFVTRGCCVACGHPAMLNRAGGCFDCVARTIDAHNQLCV